MRVGLDVHVLTGPHQGTASVWLNLLRELPPSHEYVLYSFEPREVAALFPQPHFLHRRIPPLPALARIQFAFPWMTRRDDCDVFHSNYYGPLAWSPPLVLYVHDLIYIDFPEFSTGSRRAMFATLGRASAHAAAKVLTVSNWAKQRIVDLYGMNESRIEVIPTGLEESWLVPSDSAIRTAWQRIRHRLPPRYALTVGRLDPRKNFAQAARIARALVERGLLDGLVIVGPEDFGAASLRAQLSRDGTDRYVTHLHSLDTASLQAVFRHSQCLLYLSLAEGFGMPLIEAMAMETPIIASNRTSIPEVVGDAGLIVDPDRFDDVLSTAIQLLADEALRSEIVSRATRRVRLFNAKDTAARVVSVYERAAGLA
jgi:glycosyltransferase involved in cell wall biosynthesis